VRRTQGQQQPTVGDTVTIVRRILARPGVVIEARAPGDSAIATLVSSPTLTREGDSVRIVYTIAVWTPGHSDLVLPGPVVVDQRGRVDTLPDSHVSLDVGSVLPAAKPAGTIKPQAARPWLPRADHSALPFVVLVPLALLGALLLHWRWRRRGPAPVDVTPAPVALPLTETRLHAWIAAGESRLVLDHLDAMVRSRDDFADWRERVARARFAPGDETVGTMLALEAWARLAPTPP
jgi:hypothetical protein